MCPLCSCQRYVNENCLKSLHAIVVTNTFGDGGQPRNTSTLYAQKDKKKNPEPKKIYIFVTIVTKINMYIYIICEVHQPWENQKPILNVTKRWKQGLKLTQTQKEVTTKILFRMCFKQHIIHFPNIKQHAFLTSFKISTHSSHRFYNNKWGMTTGNNILLSLQFVATTSAKIIDQQK